MAKPVNRKPLEGVWTIIRFNWHLHLIALAFIATLIAAAHLLPPAFAAPCLLMAAATALGTATSIVATWIAYDATGFYQLDWLASVMRGSTRAANIHAGFDETSVLLRSRFPESNWRIFDFYDPAKHTEISIRRARDSHPPQPDTRHITTKLIPLENSELDRVILILSAHEIRDRQERIEFFREIRRILGTDGRVVVTEHLRDLINIACYSIGAWHFFPRSEWQATFDSAGFLILEESKNSPFITTFILGKHGDPS